MTIEDIIIQGRQQGCSDIHISQGLPMKVRIHGRLIASGVELTEQETREAIESMINEKQMEKLKKLEDVDFALTTCDGHRQRVNVFQQQGKLAATIRLLHNHIPTMEELKLPKVLKELADKPRGLVLITGPTGSGKSTTLASMVNYINTRKSLHILTIEDPVEYMYDQDQATIHQREVGLDTISFASALRSALREDPDVILVGEMRDYETISAAVTAAETGHLVLSTLHTTGAAQTVDRIIDACPEGAQNQIRTQLSGILNGIITQCLIPTKDGQGRIAATEVMTGTDAALNLIREGKSYQLGTVMQSGLAFGMHTLNGDLSRLVQQGIITPEMAFQYSNDRKDLEQYL